jgi:hypothetical protein
MHSATHVWWYAGTAPHMHGGMQVGMRSAVPALICAHRILVYNKL